MNQIVLAALSLLVGLVLGGLGPRSEVRHLQKQLEEQPDGPCVSTVGADLAALMGGRNRGQQAPQRSPLGDREPAELAEMNPEAAELVESMSDEQERMEEGVREELSSGIGEEEQELARTALELRRAQARAALVEDARPDETQMEAIDTAVKDMNDSLLELADEMAEILESGEEPTRRDAMAFAADALDTMLVAEDEMRSALDADQIEQLDEGALDPFSYVGPEIIDVLGGMGEQ